MEINSYYDILDIRRHTSDFAWNTRVFNFVKSYQQQNSCSNPYKFQKEVFDSPNVQQLIIDISKSSKSPKEVVSKKVIEILLEIGHTRQLPIFRCVCLFVIKLLKRVISRVYVNQQTFLKIKSSMGNNPVIFLPSHRGYADFLLMSYILYHYDMEIPCVAAGMDFQSMWMVGKLLRDCNAFFMRRSFVGDDLYRIIFKEYVQHLIVRGEAPIEFFIEGTRSRSAKALVPKYGLLTMMLEPFFNGDVPDITIIPVSFSYERILEENLFSYELLGVPKPKESTSGFIKSLKILNENFGNVFATFNEPISLRKYLTKDLGAELDFSNRDSVKECHQITNLGYHVIECQQKNMVLNVFNLFAIVLYNHLLVSPEEPLMVEKASKDVAWLSAVFSTLGATVQTITSATAVSIVTESIKVHESLVQISPSGSIHLVTMNSDKHQQPIDERKLKGHKLSVNTMNFALPLITLQLYVNPCLHFLINSAIITVITQQAASRGSISKLSVFKKYQFMRALFTHEFVFFKPWEIQDFEDALGKLELLSIIENNPLRLGNHQKLQAMMSNLLYPFFSCYLTICKFLQTDPQEVWTERHLLQSAQKKIEEELVSGWLQQPNCLSLDVIASCISSLTSLKALFRKRIETLIQYTVNHAYLNPIVEELECLVVVPQKYHKKEFTGLDSSSQLHVIPSSEPIHRLVSKL